MVTTFWGFFYGAVGGGVVALLLKYWDVQLTDSIEAKKKLRLYSKPLWLNCHELQHRFNSIVSKIEITENGNELQPLTLSPKKADSIEWYTKEGYYITSTAYLISSVACWISLFQRDVVFLQFSQKSSTSSFFQIIELLKNKITSPPSILWYHYFNGIGEILTDEKSNRPITFASFCHRLQNDNNFKEYYDQIFQFLNQIASERHTTILKNTVNELRNVKKFLEDNNAVPKITDGSFE